MHSSWYGTSICILHLWSFNIIVNSHVLLVIIKSYFSCIAASHLFTSLHKLKGSSRHDTLAHPTSWCGKIWFFHHFPSGRHSLEGYLHFSPSFFTSTPFLTGPTFAPWSATWFSPTCSSRSSISSPISTKVYLKDASTAFTVRASFLPLWNISKLFPTLVLSTMNIIFIFYDFIILHVHEPIYFGVFKLFREQTFGTYCIKLIPLFIRHHRINNTSEYTYVLIQGLFLFHASLDIIEHKILHGH